MCALRLKVAQANACYDPGHSGSMEEKVLSQLARRRVLAFAETIADGNRKLRHPIAAELVRQVGHIMNVELRLDENIPFYVELRAKGAMDLKVIRAYPCGEAGGAIYVCNVASHHLIEHDPSATDAALDHRHNALV